jgi:hypothetical protein
MTRLAQRAAVMLSIVTLSVAARESFAQTIPYNAVGTGTYSPINGDYSGAGVGIPLGKLTFFGNVATVPTADPLVFDWESTVDQETIAANGDTIFFSSSGQVELIPLDSTGTTFSAIWTGQFVVTGGTGRYAHAKPAAKPLSVIAVNLPFTFAEAEWHFVWTLNGAIKLR